MKILLDTFIKDRMFLAFSFLMLVVAFLLVWGIKSFIYIHQWLGIQNADPGIDVWIGAFLIVLPLIQISTKLMERLKSKATQWFFPQVLKARKLILQGEIAALENNMVSAFDFYQQASGYKIDAATLQVGFMKLLGQGCQQNKEEGLDVILSVLERSKNSNFKYSGYFKLYCVFSGNQLNHDEADRENNYLKAKEFLMMCSGSCDIISNTILSSNFYAGKDGFPTDIDQAMQYHLKA